MKRVAGADGSVFVVLSGVRSMTHLIHASSYLASLVATGAEVVVEYLGSGPFLGREVVADDDAERVLGLGGAVEVRRVEGHLRRRGTAGRQLVYLSVGVPGIKPWLRMVRSDPRHPPHVVVVDEGLGSYGSWRTRRDAYRRQGGREPWPTVRSAAVSMADRILTSERWALYEQDPAGGWAVVEAVAQPFREVRRGGVGRGVALPRQAVYLTQPWVELGLLTEPAYEAHLRQAARACADRGLALAVRPHPVERTERYAAVPGIAVLPGSGLAELDQTVLDAVVALGADSTALLNVAALHGVPAVRLGLPELDVLEQRLAPRQRSLLDAFLPRPCRVADLGPALARAVPDLRGQTG